MRLQTLLLGLLAVATPLAAAWTKEDHEIFRVQDEVAVHEDPGATFYSILGVAASATVDEITKAHRIKTRSLHPDKVRQQLTKARNKAQEEAGKGKAPPPTSAEINAAIKDATARQSRLMLIVNILRDGPSRDRYDHFLKNGFPMWKGTGYYYNRYRPGLGTVVVGLFVFAGGGIHYLALYLGWRRQREFIERYIKFARETAWGSDSAIPGIDMPVIAPAPPPPAAEEEEAEEQVAVPVNRKQRRMQERENKRDTGREPSKKAKKAAPSAASAPREEPPRPAGPTGAKRRVVAENGKVLVVDSLRDVYLEVPDEDGKTTEFLLDPDEIPCPTIHDTLLVRVPTWLYSLTLGRVIPSSAPGAPKAKPKAKKHQPAPAPAPVVTSSDAAPAESSSSDPPQKRKVTPRPVEIEDESETLHTPTTDSADEFEFLDKPTTDSFYQAGKSSGSQPAGGAKPNKRRGKKK